jgi:hypothetical protein
MLDLANIAARTILAGIMLACSTSVQAQYDAPSEPAGTIRSKTFSSQAEASYTRDDNIARSFSAADKIADQMLRLDLASSTILATFDKSRLLLEGGLEVESGRQYSGLNRVRGSLAAEFQYRSSAAFDALQSALQLQAARQHGRSDLRNGSDYSISASVRTLLTDRVSVSGALTARRRNADSATFSGVDRSARLNLDYQFNRQTTLYFGAERHDGDLVSTGHASVQALDISKVFVRDDAFPDAQMFAYRFDALTWIGSIGVNVGLGRGNSIDLSWRRIDSKADLKPAFLAAAPGYTTNLVSLAYLIQF